MTNQIITGPAYRPDEAPFPEAVRATAPEPVPEPRRPARHYRTSSPRRPRTTLWRWILDGLKGPYPIGAQPAWRSAS